jgi:hypothetical protein
MFVPLAVTLLVAVPCAAQTKPIQDKIGADLLSQRQAQLMKQTEAERIEDVEILRRILNHGLGLPDQASHPAPHYNLYRRTAAPPVANLFTQEPNTWLPAYQYMMTAPQPVVSIDPFIGVSLPGYGAVYMLRIPANAPLVLDPPAKSVGLAETCRKCHGTEPASRDALEPAGDKASPPTEWDRTRQELHGAKPAGNQPQTAARVTAQQICKPGNLTERIVEKLWQNMQHVRHLAPTDRVTVAITFDGLTGSSKDRQTLNPPTEWQERFRPTEKKGIPDRLGLYPEESKLLTLGDLHLKQGKPKDAIAAYERALARFHDRPNGRFMAPSGLTAAQREEMAAELQKGVRDAYRHLAQAWLAAGDVEKGRAALNMAQKYTVRLVTANDGDKRVPVPAKLVISVTRADADKAGNSLPNFRKAVKVETIGFPPADRAKK